MYNWRQMTDEQKTEVLNNRKLNGQAWHAPANGYLKTWYHLTAACYEHQSLLGLSPNRIIDFEKVMLASLNKVCESVVAWCVLPNHYHVLIEVMNITECKKALGAVHGSSSFYWNKEENKPGRKCWHRCSVKEINSESHLFATINYIHNNPVKHGYVKKWQDWSFSSAVSYLDDIGIEKAKDMWRKYPVFNMGTGWDDL